VDKEQLADPRFTEILRQFTVADPSVDLAVATQTNSGRYWYNLHLVLVVEQRHRIGDAEVLGTIRDWSFKIAAKKGYGISRLSVMPDHLHASLRGNIAHSPEEVALAFLNNLAYALGQNARGSLSNHGPQRDFAFPESTGSRRLSRTVICHRCHWTPEACCPQTKPRSGQLHLSYPPIRGYQAAFSFGRRGRPTTALCRYDGLWQSSCRPATMRSKRHGSPQAQVCGEFG
jgi:REP element-mobilizing transposase RayT